jgi:hypothetical protein
VHISHSAAAPAYTSLHSCLAFTLHSCLLGRHSSTQLHVACSGIYTDCLSTATLGELLGLGRRPCVDGVLRVCGYTGESIARVGVHRLWTRLAVNGCLGGADVWSGDLCHLGIVGGLFVGATCEGMGGLL